MYCKNCGNRISNDSIFCEKCGTEAETKSDKHHVGNNASVVAGAEVSHGNNEAKSATALDLKDRSNWPIIGAAISFIVSIVFLNIGFSSLSEGTLYYATEALSYFILCIGFDLAGFMLIIIYNLTKVINNRK